MRAHIEGSDKIAALAFIASPEAAAARDRAFPGGRAPPAPAEPVLSTGVLDFGGSAEPLVGRVGPQGVVRREGKQGRFDDMLGWYCIPAGHLRADQLEFLQRIGGVVAGISDPQSEGFAYDLEGAYRRFFSENGIRALQMRPDFVVFGVARSASDLPKPVDRLHEQLRR